MSFSVFTHENTQKMVAKIRVFVMADTIRYDRRV